jgi:hypothetical protein
MYHATLIFLFPLYLHHRSFGNYQDAEMFMTDPDAVGRLLADASGKAIITGKGKAIPVHTWTGPEGSRNLRFPGIITVGT